MIKNNIPIMQLSPAFLSSEMSGHATDYEFINSANYKTIYWFRQLQEIISLTKPVKYLENMNYPNQNYKFKVIGLAMEDY